MMNSRRYAAMVVCLGSCACWPSQGHGNTGGLGVWGSVCSHFPAQATMVLPRQRCAGQPREAAGTRLATAWEPRLLAALRDNLMPPQWLRALARCAFRRGPVTPTRLGVHQTDSAWLSVALEHPCATWRARLIPPGSQLHWNIHVQRGMMAHGGTFMLMLPDVWRKTLISQATHLSPCLDPFPYGPYHTLLSCWQSVVGNMLERTAFSDSMSLMLLALASLDSCLFFVAAVWGSSCRSERLMPSRSPRKNVVGSASTYFLSVDGAPVALSPTQPTLLACLPFSVSFSSCPAASFDVLVAV